MKPIPITPKLWRVGMLRYRYLDIPLTHREPRSDKLWERLILALSAAIITYIALIEWVKLWSE